MKRWKKFAKVVVLLLLLAVWANLVADKVSKWVSEDETAGMAELYVQKVK